MVAESYSGGIAERYATAAFEIAREEDSLDQLERDVDALGEALDESDALRELIASPVYTREQQERGIGAVADRMGLGATLANTLRLMATKRRLFVLRGLLSDLRAMIAEHRGQVTAEVVSAHPMNEPQRDRLAQTLRDKVGRDVKIEARTDESLIGGMVVRVGSKMIDTSIRSRLQALETTLRHAS
jgi:F-type H+-transporting ATPase subunit delta